MNPQPKPRILIVDDEEDIVTNLEAFLEEEGYEVLTAREGETAFEKIEEEKPNLVLLDLNIPKMSGLQILEKLKPKETGIKVLIFSGIATKAERDQALSLGASGYLNKPIQIATLLTELRRLVRRPGAP